MRTRFIGSMLTLLVAVAAGVAARQAGPAQLAFEAARMMEVVDHDLFGAIVQYRAVVAKYASDRAVVPEALLRLAACQEQLGQTDARSTYARLVRDYPDSTAAKAARVKLGTLAQQGSGLTTTRLGPEWKMNTPSFDGRYATFDDAGNLAVRDLKTGKTRRLTEKTSAAADYPFVVGSVPSPDGRKIAYALAVADESWEVRVIDYEGGQSKLLCCAELVAETKPRGVVVSVLGWSPNGKEILLTFSGMSRGPVVEWWTRLLAVSVTGGAPRVLKTLDSDVYMRGGWSSDGRFIAYQAPAAPGKAEFDVFIMHADGSNDERLIGHAANDRMMDWFPDGKRILFKSDRTGVNGLWSQTVTEGKAVGEPVLVKDLVGEAWPIGFTRDGAYFYFVRDFAKDVITARLDGSGALSGTVDALSSRFTGGKLSAVWSPDGSQIAFVQPPPNVSMAPSLSIQTIASGSVRSIQVELKTILEPAWTPDGLAIIVAGFTSDGREGLFRIQLDTGALSALGETAVATRDLRYDPCVSSDGREVYYTIGLGAGGIQARDLVSGAIRTVLAGPVYGFALSPDGRFIAAGAKPPKLPDNPPPVRIVSVSGGEPRSLATGLEPANHNGAIAWSADGLYVLFTRRGALWRVPVAGGPAEATSFSTRAWLSRLSVHPNGLLAISTERFGFEYWVMRNIPKAVGR